MDEWIKSRILYAPGGNLGVAFPSGIASTLVSRQRAGAKGVGDGLVAGGNLHSMRSMQNYPNQRYVE